MQWATVQDGSAPEVVYFTAKNSATKTLTATAATIAKGEPVVLATNTASNNGVFIQRAATATSPVNNLYVGCVHDFPGTASNKTWQGEDVGLVQVYGYDADAVVQLLTDAVAVGQILIPNSIRAMINSGPPTTHTTTATGVGINGLAGFCVVVAEVASSSATSTGTAVVFHRAM